MVTFLFWNILNRDLREQIKSLVEAHRVDALILAESPYSPAELSSLLAEMPTRRLVVARTDCERIQLATSGILSDVASIYDETDSRLTMWRFIWERREILLAAVHLPSIKQMPKSADRAKIAGRVARRIIEKETDLGHSRTVLVGDFNMDPHEDGVVSSDAFHGVMTQQLARREQRTVQHESFPMFYNPMWSCFGDRSPGPPGTYYHSESNPGDQFWHMLDQVLLRPSVMGTLAELQILERAGDWKLLDQHGRPDKQTHSDHLPLLFRLTSLED